MTTMLAADTMPWEIGPVEVAHATQADAWFVGLAAPEAGGDPAAYLAGWLGAQGGVVRAPIARVDPARRRVQTADGLVFELNQSGGNADASAVWPRFLRKRGLVEVRLVTNDLDKLMSHAGLQRLMAVQAPWDDAPPSASSRRL